MAIQPVETITNLFTNPNLVGDGTWAEVRRNLVTNPRASGLDGWDIAWQASNWTRTLMSEDGVTFVRFENIASGTFLLELGMTDPIVGHTYSARVEVRPSISTGNARVYMAGTGHVNYVTLPANEWSEVKWEDVVAVTSDWARFNIEQSLPAGTVIDVRMPLVEKAPYLGPYFDGSTTPETAGDTVQPEDFRWRWLGTPNASESVMEIERVRGLTGVNAIAGVSSRDGEPALRLIPNSVSTVSYGTFNMPTGLVRNGGVVLATVSIDAPLTGSPQPARVQVNDPYQNSKATPNVAGVYPKRLDYTELSGVYRVILRHGGAQGSGDVWWTDIGLFAGVYDGPAFNGYSEPFYYKGELVYPFWNGEPNNSSSSFHYYDLASYITPPLWNQPTQRIYEVGVDRVVFYDENSNGTAWSGITAINEQPVGGSPQPVYVDGIKVSNALDLEEFEATIEAYAAPKEFDIHDGSFQMYNGLFLAQQRRLPFHLTYRTLVGNDTEGSEYGYKIHLVYNAIAEPSEVSRKTLGGSIDPVLYSWKVTTLPEFAPGVKPTSHIVIDTRSTPLYQLRSLEDILYGISTESPRMPTLSELISLFSGQSEE